MGTQPPRHPPRHPSLYFCPAPLSKPSLPSSMQNGNGHSELSHVKIKTPNRFAVGHPFGHIEKNSDPGTHGPADPRVMFYLKCISIFVVSKYLCMHKGSLVRSLAPSLPHRGPPKNSFQKKGKLTDCHNSAPQTCEKAIAVRRPWYRLRPISREHAMPR